MVTRLDTRSGWVLHTSSSSLDLTLQAACCCRQTQMVTRLDTIGDLLLQTLQRHFSSLRQRLLSCELADFGMDKDADWALISPQVASHPFVTMIVYGALL